MSRLTDTLRAAVAKGDRAFIPFLPAGYPDLVTSERALVAMADAGADAVEIGVPYADSLADGPVVQGAYHQALARGATLEATLALVRRLSSAGFPPIVLMVAYNVIFRVGLERFSAMAREAGAAAILPPDLPVEESCGLAGALAAHELDGIRLVAPTTTAARLGSVLQGATGFVYYISRKGVTGVRQALAPDLEAGVTQLRAATPLPVAVGFGISTPAQASAVGRIADAVIIGSALLQALEGGVEPCAALASELRTALRGLGPLAPPPSP